MKKSEVEKRLVDGRVVAVVQSDNFSPLFGVVTAMNAARRVHHGSRDFSGSIVMDGVEVTFDNGRKDTFPLNQIKDADEVRDERRARDERRRSTEDTIAQQRASCEESVRAIFDATGVLAEVKPNTAYGDYRITGYHVALSASAAARLATSVQS